MDIDWILEKRNKMIKIQALEEALKKEKLPYAKYHIWEEIKKIKEELNEGDRKNQNIRL